MILVADSGPVAPVCNRGAAKRVRQWSGGRHRPIVSLDYPCNVAPADQAHYRGAASGETSLSGCSGVAPARVEAVSKEALFGCLRCRRQ
jgi:hypothetical protein